LLLASTIKTCVKPSTNCPQLMEAQNRCVGNQVPDDGAMTRKLCQVAVSWTSTINNRRQNRSWSRSSWISCWRSIKNTVLFSVHIIF